MSSPEYYTNGSGVECEEIIDVLTTDRPAAEAWRLSCITRYLYRYGRKTEDGSKDLCKARKYLDELILLETEKHQDSEQVYSF